MIRQNTKLTKVNENNENNLVKSLKTDNIPSYEANMLLNSELNLRSLLGTFMMGTGAEDVSKFMSTIGAGGGPAFERQFYLNQSAACRIILCRCRVIVRNAMLEEIAITMWDQDAYGNSSNRHDGALKV